MKLSNDQAIHEARIWEYYLALASRPNTMRNFSCRSIYVESYNVAVDAVCHYEKKIKEAKEKSRGYT